MGLGRNTGFKCQLDGAQHRLFIVLKHQCEDLDHLPVTTRVLEQLTLHLPEGFRQLGEGAPLRRAPGLRWMTAR